MKTFNADVTIKIPKEAHQFAEQLDKDIQETVDAIGKIKTKNREIMFMTMMHGALHGITNKYNDLEEYVCKSCEEKEDFVETMQKMHKFAHHLIDIVKEELTMDKTAYIANEYKQNKKKEQNND